MSAGRDKNFITFFTAFVGLGAVALSVLLYMGYKQYDTVSVSYDEKGAELQRLQSLKPYPNSENLAKLEKARDAFKEKISELQTGLASKNTPLVPITPNQFQDTLREMLAGVVKFAEANRVQLADGFYLGFEQYQDVPPSAEAAPKLLRQLKVVNSVVRDLIENRILSLTSVERTPLPEETGKIVAALDGGKQGNVQTPVLERDILRVRFESESGVIRQAINSLVNAKQIFIIRTLSITNEKLEGPSRQGMGTSIPEYTPPPEQGVLAPGSGKRMEFIVGTEKISADLRLEIIDFINPEKSDSKQSAAN